MGTVCEWGSLVMSLKLVLLFCIIILLLVVPVSAKEITSKVEDKKIIHSYGDGKYFIHTVDFGDIEVTETEYQQVFINDTVTFDTNSKWGFYTILKINDVALTL